MPGIDEVVHCEHEFCSPFHGYGKMENASRLGYRAGLCAAQQRFEEAEQLLNLARTQLEDAKPLIWPIDAFGNRMLSELEKHCTNAELELAVGKLLRVLP